LKTTTKFSPSLLEHLAICPGYIPEPFEGPKKAADEGKFLHKALETGQLAGLDAEQTLCVSKVRQAFARALARLGGRERILIKREEWVGVEDFNRGIIDLLALRDDRALICDAKFGRRLVSDAETNMQGISYAVSVFEEYPQVEQIEVLFAQPRCNSITSAIFLRDQYHNLLIQLKAVRANVHKFSETQDTSMLRPDETNCSYCGNLADCPVMGGKVVAIAKAYDIAHDGELPELFHPAQLATPERRAQAEAMRRIMTKWCESVQKHNVQHRLNGEEIPGYELVTQLGDRTITQPVIAWETAQEICDGKLTESDLAACSKLSIAQLEKVVGSKFPRGQKGIQKQRLEDELIHREAMSTPGESYYLKKISPGQKPKLKDTTT